MAIVIISQGPSLADSIYSYFQDLFAFPDVFSENAANEKLRDNHGK